MANGGGSINVNLNVTAETARARQQLKQFHDALNGLLDAPNLGSVFKGSSAELQKLISQTAALRSTLLKTSDMKTGLLDFSQFNRSLNDSKINLNDYMTNLLKLGPAGQAVFTKLAQSVAQAEVPVNRANKLLTDFFNTLKNNARWQLTSEIVDGFIHGLQGAFTYAEKLDKSLNNIRIVSGQTASEMAEFAKQASKAAREFSTTTVEYTDASLIYAQQGLKGEDVTERADITVQMANVTGDSVDVVSDQLTSIWNNFAKSSDMALERYADVLTALGAATASSTDEIADGLQKFSSISDMIGLSFESAAASLATITATTRQSADIVGTALKVSA